LIVFVAREEPCGEEVPLLVDLMCGPDAPSTRGSILVRWRCFQGDYLIDPNQDLPDAEVKVSGHKRLREDFVILAALNCSTETRAWDQFERTRIAVFTGGPTWR
jgi:hypothetical protein